MTGTFKDYIREICDKDIDTMTVEEWLGEDNQLGIDIWNKKYRYNDESFGDWLFRVSGGLSDVAEMILKKEFLFGGRILATRNIDDGIKASYSNCYVISPPEDNLESIYNTCRDMARTYSYGGGVGIDISKLAPEGAAVHNQAKTSSGAVSFMDTFSQVTQQIGQKGRRGALMISMDCTHPDIEKFIKVKTDLNKVNFANISVRVSDAFMEAVEYDADWELYFERKETGETISRSVKAKDLFRLLCECNWNYAEPGILFWDRIEGYNLQSENPDFKYAGVNPCVTGETLISTTKGDIQIKDLVGKTPDVYCMDDDGNLTIKKASKVWLTRKNASVVTIHTHRGSLKCTPDHLIHTRNRGWVQAQDLKHGDWITGINRQAQYYIDNDIKGVLHSNKYVESVESVVSDIETRDVYDMTVPDVHNFIANRMVVHNCGEEPLPDSGSCLLGSLNLSAFVRYDEYGNPSFDMKRFAECVHIAVDALNGVQEQGTPKHPLESQRKCASEWRQIGLGIMGLADMLIKMRMRYGGADSIDLCDWIGMTLASSAISESASLAGEGWSRYPAWSDKVLDSQFFKTHAPYEELEDIRETGLANSQLLTIAPTGTLSTMLGISGGIEPIFANSYTRTTKTLHGDKDVVYKVYTPIVREYMESHGLSDESELPDYFVTAPDIPVDDRILMQAVWQSHIDASISSTVNLPNEATVEDVERIYMEAWEQGLKGITIYRAGCAREGILNADGEKPKEKEEPQAEPILYKPVKNIGLERHLTTGCGSLHICAYFDENGELRNTYLSKGSTGGCNNFMIGLSRMISLSARNGVGIEAIVDQLNSCGSCPSYAVRRATKHDTSVGSCCPVAIGNALMDMWREVNEINTSVWEANKIDTNVNEAVSTQEEETYKSCSDRGAGICPECGGELRHEMGCVTCMSCGYSKCG